MQTVLNLVQTSSKEELIWINGYIAGIINEQQSIVVDNKKAIGVENKITIIYATETGNSKQLATQFASIAKKNKLPVKLYSVDQYVFNQLPKENILIVVISTQGDGEPPAAAQVFFNSLFNENIQLNNLNYAVVGLGDSSYPEFCKAGIDVDAQLDKLGANRLQQLLKCDVEYEAVAMNWFHELLQLLKNQQSPIQQPQINTISSTVKNEKKFYEACITKQILLNDVGSTHNTYHIELSVADIDYLPGDSIGIYPENNPETVQSILDCLQLNPNYIVEWRSEKFTIENLLKKKVNIHYLSEKWIQNYAQSVQCEIPFTRMDLLDLLKIYPINPKNQLNEIIQLLTPQLPRLYTIASAPNVHEDSLHLTVNFETFLVQQTIKYGVGSSYLKNLEVGSQLSFFVQKNKRFKLPESHIPVIMIAHGTGIAPFRSFLHQRDANGDEGLNWLFFENENFVTDFLYQTEIQNWLALGHLNNLHVCFQKNIFQPSTLTEQLINNSYELFQLINNGAYIYVSGEKEYTGSVIDDALLQIIENKNGKDAALAKLQQLKKEGRYVKEIY
ncbi:diflavin oxidoreductase [Hydrotalea sp.]|uniref:diflavin oxidoreductase n=1 Tax=Hydrotalea sp. TaxID=2881279 RepID=UPI003D0DBCAF